MVEEIVQRRLQVDSRRRVRAGSRTATSVRSRAGGPSGCDLDRDPQVWIGLHRQSRSGTPRVRTGTSRKRLGAYGKNRFAARDTSVRRTCQGHVRGLQELVASVLEDHGCPPERGLGRGTHPDDAGGQADRRRVSQPTVVRVLATRSPRGAWPCASISACAEVRHSRAEYEHLVATSWRRIQRRTRSERTKRKIWIASWYPERDFVALRSGGAAPGFARVRLAGKVLEGSDTWMIDFPFGPPAEVAEAAGCNSWH